MIRLQGVPDFCHCLAIAKLYQCCGTHRAASCPAGTTALVAVVFMAFPSFFMAPMLPSDAALPPFALASGNTALMVAGALLLVHSASLSCLADASEKGNLTKSATYKCAPHPPSFRSAMNATRPGCPRSPTQRRQVNHIISSQRVSHRRDLISNTQQQVPSFSSQIPTAYNPTCLTRPQIQTRVKQTQPESAGA